MSRQKENQMPRKLKTVDYVKVQHSETKILFEVKLISGQTLTANTETVENLEIVDDKIFSVGNMIAGFKYSVGESLRIGTLNVQGSGLTPTAAMNAWRKATLECLDTGIKIPFLEFVADAIQVTEKKHSALKTSYATQLMNCRTKVVVDGNVQSECELYSFRDFVEFYACSDTQRVWMVSRFYVSSGYKISNPVLLSLFEDFAATRGCKYDDYVLE
jgi:hypothetical protein